MLAVAHVRFIVLPPVLAGLDIWRRGGWADRRQVVERFLLHYLVIGVGIQGIGAGEPASGPSRAGAGPPPQGGSAATV